jgi:hypothetical protein
MKRNPNATARNKIIKSIKDELRSIIDLVMFEIDKDSEQSVNTYIGSKNDDFLDLKNDVIKSPDEFISKWLQGLDKGYKEGKGNRFKSMHDNLKKKENLYFKKYVALFLKRSFLKKYEELSKTRPQQDEGHFWFGVNDADYGVFITPRFNTATKEWENDVSEIRAFNQLYWTIGHVLKTGVVYPGRNKIKKFKTCADYLDFFYDQVRLTKSLYQIEIAEKYINFVKANPAPNLVPLLIPEVRFNPGRKHEYRLDFLMINPLTMDKIGIELSPWSSHGQLSGKHKNLSELNKEALDNFEKEIKKMKAYFKKYKIYTLIFPDSELKNIEELFNDIKKYLVVSVPSEQLSLDLFEDYLS